MRKIFSLFLAFAMMISLGVTALAVEINESDSVFAVLDTGESTQYYNPGDTIYLNFTVTNVTLPAGDGISAMDFEIGVDTDMVTLSAESTSDSDGDNCDYTSLVTSNPGDAWEGFGMMDTERSLFCIAFADFNVTNVITADNTFSVSIPFKVKNIDTVEDIVFTFERATAYNAGLTLYCDMEVDSVVVHRAVQPGSTEALPSDSIKLQIAGYKHDINNVIYAPRTEMTVSDYVYKFMDPVSGQDSMSGFAVIMVDSRGVVVDFDLSDGDKSDMVIPASGYIIGIHSDNTSDISYLSDNLSLGNMVLLYNIKVEATCNLESGMALTNAGFSLTDFAVKPEANAYFEPAEMIVTVYEDKVTLEEFKAMFECDITVLDANGNLLESGKTVTTGMTIDYASGVKIIVLGDCNFDGAVDIFDCLTLKSHLLRGLELSEDAYRAVCLYEDTPSTFDYLAMKNYHFGKLSLVQFKPKG